MIEGMVRRWVCMFNKASENIHDGDESSVDDFVALSDRGK